jgi:hypothetical protein
LMIEHLNESQLVKGLRFIYKKAEAMGIMFEGSDQRENLADIESAGGAWFAPHL